jgi:MoaA/NifB/PqqE/SkfB family radical SAM enzyme
MANLMNRLTQKLKPYLSEKVRANFTVDFDNWGGTIQPKDMSGAMKMRRLPPQLDVPCQGLFGFAIRHDGNVRLCGCRLTRTDLDDLVVGNLHQKSLAEISRSDEAWNIIKGIYSGKRPKPASAASFTTPLTKSG